MFYCEYVQGKCYFRDSCDWLKNNGFPIPFDINITLADGGVYTIKSDYLLMDGKYFAYQNKEDKCYFGMFRGDTLKDGEWELGSIAMQDYYIVFDLEVKIDDQFSPPLPYRSVGIGKKNPYDIIKQIHYNTSYAGY